QGDNIERLHDYIDRGVLLKKSFDYEELLEIQLLEVEHRVLSIPDCSCLFHARSLSAQLLTGDAALRKTAEQAGISVHGILWVLEELVKHEVVTKDTAHAKLHQLLAINPRLPRSECRKRLMKWKEE
ncbi:MAG: type II toxin-antitoxin system VapC family toxin, partial [Candidatus Electrothrix sp. AR3]|nr:type II toxin-antitoxin system VapC family toxin [Candidatus Electrothrix sp. AR3]